MPLLLRTVREHRWYKSEAARWLAEGDIPADPLGDCTTSQNRLSVYEVAEDQSNLERIIRAVAVGKDKIADTGYVIFSSDLVEVAGIATSVAVGTTPDKGVNDWHRDLTELSGNKLLRLVRAILEDGQSGTILKKRLRELVEQGIREKHLPEKLQSKLAN